MSVNKSLIAYAVIAATAVLSAGSVFAQEATPDTWMAAGLGGKSRAEVSAELSSARQSGLTRSWSAGYIEPVRTNLARDQVRADTRQALANGEIRAINATVYSYTPAAPQRVALAAR